MFSSCEYWLPPTDDRQAGRQTDRSMDTQTAFHYIIALGTTHEPVSAILVQFEQKRKLVSCLLNYLHSLLNIF